MVELRAATALAERPTAILFDIDGTLIDSNMLHVEAWGRAFNEHGHVLATDAILQQIGKGGDKLVPALLPDVSDDEHQAISKQHGVLYKQFYLKNAKPFAGAQDLLRRVHASGCKVVLASSAEQDELDHYIDILDISAIVEATTSIDDVDESKPAPDIFNAALKKAKVPASGALVIGDTVWDIEADAKICVPAIGLLSGGIDERKLRAAGAVAIYGNVADILSQYGTSPLYMVR